MLISVLSFLEVRNIADELCRENQNTYLRSVAFSENIVFRNNVAKYDRDTQATDEKIIRRVRFAS